jgi:hypothetical protein
MDSHNKTDIEKVGPATVYKNVLNPESFVEIKNAFFSQLVPWRYTSCIVVNEDGTSPDTFQFVHSIYQDAKPVSPAFDILRPLIEKINPQIIYRIKANLGPRSSEHIVGGFHVDTNQPCTTAVYYLNTNNGYTMFEDGSKIQSIENTLVEFDSENKHTGVSQTDAQVRVVINLNYVR